MIVTQNRKKIHKNSALSGEASKSLSGPRTVADDIPEPDKVSAAPSGYSGNDDSEETKPAWIEIKSEVLNGARILLIRDDLYEDSELLERVPEEKLEAVEATYRMTEVDNLIESEPAPQDVREIHEVKKQFSGKIIDPDETESTPWPPSFEDAPEEYPEREPGLYGRDDESILMDAPEWRARKRIQELFPEKF